MTQHRMNFTALATCLIVSTLSLNRADVLKERPLLHGHINEISIGSDGLTLDISAIGGCQGGHYQADLRVLTDSDLNRILTTLLTLMTNSALSVCIITKANVRLQPLIVFQ